MGRRKRVRSFHDLNNFMVETGDMAMGHGLNRNGTTNDNEFQDDHIAAIPPKSIQPLGRQPGRDLSIEDEHKLYSVQQTFEEGILNRLSQRQRECFNDVIISGDTYDDVAVRYHITKSAVQIYVKRAGVQIRKFIEERDGI